MHMVDMWETRRSTNDKTWDLDTSNALEIVTWPTAARRGGWANSVGLDALKTSHCNTRAMHTLEAASLVITLISTCHRQHLLLQSPYRLVDTSKQCQPSRYCRQISHVGHCGLHAHVAHLVPAPVSSAW